jgi:hypothetical protein
MHVLVDYDNIPNALRSSGPQYVADRICVALEQTVLATLVKSPRLDIRFYGGWYLGPNLSNAGQRLSAHVQRAFPFIYRVASAPAPLPVTVSGDLAHALVVLPRRTLDHTFRQRPTSERIACSHPQAAGCARKPCPMEAMYDFFQSEKCPEAGCSLGIGDLIQSRGEQKLVDTMIVADLIHLSHNGETEVAVVTADDDVWPGVITGMQAGTHVVHIWPKYQQASPRYLSGVPGRYSPVAL